MYDISAERPHTYFAVKTMNTSMKLDELTRMLTCRSNKMQILYQELKPSLGQHLRALDKSVRLCVAARALSFCPQNLENKSCLSSDTVNDSANRDVPVKN